MELQENKNNQNGMIVAMNDENKLNDDMTIGHYLKQAREKKSLSIDAISRHTKISATNLEYLETNNKKALPNIAYVKGFVKSYCKIVDLDLDNCLELLNRLYDIKNPVIIEEEKPATAQLVKPASFRNTSKQNKPTEPKSVVPQQVNPLVYKAAAAVLLLSVGVAILLGRDTQKSDNTQIEPQSVSKNSPLTSNTQELPEEVKIEASEQTQTEAQVVLPTATPEVITAPETKSAVETPTPAVIEVAPEIKPVPKVEAPSSEKQDKIIKDDKEFYNFPYPLYEVSKNSSKEISNIPSNYRNSLQADKQNVFITATNGDTWITYKSDSDPVKKFVLKEGRFIMIRGADVRVFLGNVTATKIFLNNELLDVKTTSGVKSLVFPQELSKNLKLPLFVFKDDGSAITSEDFLLGN